MTAPGFHCLGCNISNGRRGVDEQTGCCWPCTEIRDKFISSALRALITADDDGELPDAQFLALDAVEYANAALRARNGLLRVVTRNGEQHVLISADEPGKPTPKPADPVFVEDKR